jgi:two-component system LytT family response regulator
LEAMPILSSKKTDLIFCDIQMPQITGVDFVKSLTNPPKVIFTTAYPEFGAESYEYNAIDYLLKPVKYERFLKAVNKAVELSSDNDSLKEEKIKDFDINESSDFIYLKSGTQIHKIKIDSIMYIEAAGNYMTFYTNTKKLMTLLSMKEVLELLPSNTFTRIHKSFIVSMNYIDIIEKHRVIINNQPIPIGVTYRQKFHQNFDKN